MSHHYATMTSSTGRCTTGLPSMSASTPHTAMSAYSWMQPRMSSLCRQGAGRGGQVNTSVGKGGSGPLLDEAPYHVGVLQGAGLAGRSKNMWGAGRALP